VGNKGCLKFKNPRRINIKSLVTENSLNSHLWSSWFFGCQKFLTQVRPQSNETPPHIPMASYCIFLPKTKNLVQPYLLSGVTPSFSFSLLTPQSISFRNVHVIFLLLRWGPPSMDELPSNYL